MKKMILLIMVLNASPLFLAGCGKPSGTDLAELKKAYSPSLDTDVTGDPQYNFSSFASTAWKTKVEMAVAELKRYTGVPETKLLAPERFDKTHPRYDPPNDMKLVVVLPVGTRIQIKGLMKDNGVWGAVQVAAILEDGTNAQTTAYLDNKLLANNIFLHFGPTTSKNWSVNPDMLEAVK